MGWLDSKTDLPLILGNGDKLNIYHSLWPCPLPLGVTAKVSSPGMMGDPSQTTARELENSCVDR